MKSHLLQICVRRNVRVAGVYGRVLRQEEDPFVRRRRLAQERQSPLDSAERIQHQDQAL